MLWHLKRNWQISETNMTDIWDERDRYLRQALEITKTKRTKMWLTFLNINNVLFYFSKPVDTAYKASTNLLRNQVRKANKMPSRQQKMARSSSINKIRRCYGRIIKLFFKHYLSLLVCIGYKTPTQEVHINIHNQ